MKLFFILFFVLPILISDISSQQYDKKTEELIKNLRGIRVKVLKLNKDIKKMGLLEKEIKKEVEDTLLAAGIAILNNESWIKDPSKASLSVQIVMNKSNVQYFYNVNIYVHIKQISIIKRGRGEKDLETTWFRSPMLHIKEERFRDEIKKGLKNVVGNFLTAYLEKEKNIQ